jgi:hypothetical protein
MRLGVSCFFFIHDLMDGSMNRMDTSASNRFFEGRKWIKVEFLLIIWDLFLLGIVYEFFFFLLDVVRHLG